MKGLKYSMSNLCGFFERTRQAFYKLTQHGLQLELWDQKVLEEVKTIRRRQPRVGTRKLFSFPISGLRTPLHAKLCFAKLERVARCCQSKMTFGKISRVSFPQENHSTAQERLASCRILKWPRHSFKSAWR